MTDPSDPDLRGWDRDRDGLMADYEDIEPGVDIEPYNPAKDPVLKERRKEAVRERAPDTNPAMLQLPYALKQRGADVFVVDGWGSRSASTLGMGKVHGTISHWIVSTLQGSKTARQTLGLIINGHSTLSGPLANLYLGWDGAVGCVAAGRANHGGVGGWRGVSGNQYFVGVEAEGPPFTSEQMEAYPKILAAVYDVFGQHPRDWGISHKEYAPDRKIDVGDYIYQIRAEAIRLVDHNIFADTQEDDMYDDKARLEVVGRLDRALGILDALHPTVAQMQVGLMDPESGVRALLLKLLAEDSEKVGITATEIAAAIPDGIAEDVANALARRLASPDTTEGV